MTRSILTGVIFATMSASLAFAAGPFDGQWKGGSPAGGRTSSGRSCPSSIATVTITDSAISGNYQISTYTFPIKGKVAADGSVSGYWSAYPMKGKFAGSHFDGTYQSKECGVERAITLDKAG
jgi:hypothetical protein